MELLISRSERFHPAVDQLVIQKQREVLAVVLNVLPVRGRAGISSGPAGIASVKCEDLPGQRRGEPDLLQVLHAPAHHALKADRIDDACCLLFRNILPCRLEADPVPFRPGVGHLAYRLLRQLHHVGGEAKIVFRNILAVAVDGPEVEEVRAGQDRVRRLRLVRELSRHLEERLFLRVV